MMKIKKIIFPLFFVCLLLYLIEQFYFSKKDHNHVPVIEKSFLNKINISEKLISQEKLDSINCFSLKNIFISPYLCLHDIDKDFTSKQVYIYRIKENKIITFFMNYLKNNSDIIFFDIGSHVGLYTMYAAKFGVEVIAVDAFVENIYRLQKAAKLNKVEAKITLLFNAISYKNGQNVQLKYNKNIGQQTLIGQDSNLHDENSVKTITLDDLVSVIPKSNNGYKYKKALLKIDIEGFEPFAFRRSEILFSVLEFQLIIMEWIQIKNNKKLYLKEIESLIFFFTTKNYKPYDHNDILKIENWENWPTDVYWIKEK